jgi:hypothetical protein
MVEIRAEDSAIFPAYDGHALEGTAAGAPLKRPGARTDDTFSEALSGGGRSRS